MLFCSIDTQPFVHVTTLCIILLVSEMRLTWLLTGFIFYRIMKSMIIQEQLYHILKLKYSVLPLPPTTRWPSLYSSSNLSFERNCLSV